VNGLPDGGHLVDTFVVQTTDGTTKTISIDIFGANDFTPPSTFTGTGDANDFDDLVGSGAANNSATILGDNTLADNITGGSSGQNIDGRGGDDFIFAGGGDDTVVGNAGNDTLYGQAGNDNVSGSNGLDAVYGGSGNDQLNGGNDADALYGGSGNDFLGGAGGDDLLVGGFGSDRMIGGQGADTFRMLDLRDTNDRIEDFVFGTDTLDLQALDADATTGGNQTFAWGGGTATAHGVWLVQDGANTIVYADTDGNLDTAEFAVTLLNVTYADPLASPPPNFLL
jgi:Ca2+-binding RTX toxin-like protein